MNDKGYNLLMCTYFECLVNIFGVETACIIIYDLNKKRGQKL